MRAALTFVLSVAASAASAHPSVVAHEHPHGVSVLPDAAALLIGAALVLGGLAVLRLIRQR
jgi:hypothetical protein